MMAEPAEDRTLDRELADAVRGELDDGRLALLELRLHMELRDLDPVVSIGGGRDDADGPPALDRDRARVELVLPGSHRDLPGLACGRGVLRPSARGRPGEERARR